MSKFANRLAALESVHGKKKAAVFVFPTATTPEHHFKSDEDFYKSQAVLKFGRDDFDVTVFPSKEERKEPVFDFIEDLTAFFDDIANNSNRIGFPPASRGAEPVAPLQST